jgi:adenylate cyclase
MSVIDWFETASIRLSRPEPAAQPEARDEAAEPCEGAIWAQIERICSGPEFAPSARLTRFLRFITEETLAGRGDRLKAYTIALGVFERRESFDSQADPIVRIEAGRLRRMLEHYYLTQGRDDPVQVTVPKGGYTPHFTWRAPEASAPSTAASVPVTSAVPRPRAKRLGAAFVAGALVLAATGGWVARWLTSPPAEVAVPTVVVLPFSADAKDSASQALASGVSDELIDRLAAFGELRVMGRETSRWAQREFDLDRLRSQFGVRYLVEGSVRLNGDRISVVARLVDTKSGAVIWLDHFDDRPVSDASNLQIEVAQTLASKIGQPYGIIFRHDTGQFAGRGTLDWAGYRCTLQYYNYRIELSRESHAAARDCLEQLVSRIPTFATGWGMLSMIYLDEDRGGYPSGPGQKGLQGALDAGRKAVAADPDDVRALQALSLALYFAGRPDEGLAAGEKALAINPNDPELLSELGARIAQAGDPARGRDLLMKAMTLNPGNSGYYMGNLALISFTEGRTEQAVNEIEASNLSRYSGYHIVAALVYAQAGRLDDARREGEVVMRTRPGFASHFDAEMRKRNFAPAAVERIRNALTLAGVPVPTARASMLEP